MEADSEFLINLGKNLKKLRSEKGVSLREFELRGDIDRHTLSRIENGKANPTILTLHKICSALEIGISILFQKDQDHEE